LNGIHFLDIQQMNPEKITLRIVNPPTSQKIGTVNHYGVSYLMMFKTGKSKRPTGKVQLEHVLDVLENLDDSDTGLVAQ